MEIIQDQPSSEIRPEERNWGMACHLAALAGLLAIPFANLLGPLIVWLLKRNEMPFVEEQGKESLNFQISAVLAGLVLGGVVLVLYVIVGILTAILGFFAVLGVLVGILAFFAGAALVIGAFGFAIYGAIQCSNGVHYRYPYCIRLIK